jgi:hypothetical protein
MAARPVRLPKGLRTPGMTTLQSTSFWSQGILGIKLQFVQFT